MRAVAGSMLRCGNLTRLYKTYFMQYLNSSFGNDRYVHGKTNEEEMMELTRKLNYPVEDILRAVQEVGSDREDVEEYIRDRYNRS